MEGKEFKVSPEILALQSDRFFNYLIDFAVQYAFIIVLGMTFVFVSDLLGSYQLVEWIAGINSFQEYLFGTVVSLCYYFLSEMYFSRTIGKLATKTIVVMIDGSKPTAITILKRTLCRLIPFDGLTFLGRQRGWHDSIPDVYVVKKTALEESRELFYAFDQIGETELN
jgi:uncharacterized RDD family membrane protein YckC